MFWGHHAENKTLCQHSVINQIILWQYKPVTQTAGAIKKFEKGSQIRETVFNLPCLVFSKLVSGLRCSVRWFSVSMERKTLLPFWSSFILRGISLNCLFPTVSYSTSEIPAWSIFAQHDRKKGVHIRRYKSWTLHELSSWV